MEHSQLQSSTQGFYIFADDSTALGTGKTGLTITATLSKSGAAANAIAPTISELGNGIYWVAPLAAHRDTLGRSAWQFSATGAVIAPRFEKVVAVNDQVARFGASSAGDEMGITPAATDEIASAIVSDGPITTSSGAVVIVNSFADGALTAAAIADGAITGAKLDTYCITETQISPSGVQRITDGLKALLEDVPTNAEFAARTLPAAEYFDPAADIVKADNRNGDIVATAADLATVAGYLDAEIAAILTIANKLDTALEDDGASGWQYTVLALENGPAGEGALTAGQIAQLTAIYNLTATSGESETLNSTATDEIAAAASADTIVLPAAYTSQKRIAGTTLSAFVGELLPISLTVLDELDAPVDLSALTLEFVVTAKGKTTVIGTIADTSISVTGGDNNVAELTLTEAMTNLVVTRSWSLRNAANEVVLGQGDLVVRFAANN